MKTIKNTILRIKTNNDILIHGGDKASELPLSDKWVKQRLKETNDELEFALKQIDNIHRELQSVKQYI